MAGLEHLHSKLRGFAANFDVPVPIWSIKLSPMHRSISESWILLPLANGDLY